MSRASFLQRYDFPLDPFQLAAADALDEGRSVLVAAPTGAGKTVVAEYGIESALASGHKAFYTTPLKALSNQKFGDLTERYGQGRVGLLTGDNTINGEADVVVMTTEVLRNMLYERSSTLQGLRVVIMDEVHYLQDPYRGAVWEEVLIHLPASIAVVCLSATISNAEEFGEWIESLRGPTEVIIEERRPVPLEHHYLVGRQLHAMHVDEDGRPKANPYLVSLDQREMQVSLHRRRSSGRQQEHRRTRPREGHRRMYAPRREDVVEILNESDMLPAIYFVFSRAGCDRAVRGLRESGVRLTSREEADRIRQIVDERARWLDDPDRETLGFYDFREGLAAGIAAHHAGMLPAFKETVEALFEQGLVKVVFATETLSLGINMPARTVVIEDLWKFQGERHEMLTAGQYTQLTGRAGRRGIDAVGHAVVLYQRDVEFERIASLASTRTYELRSSFRPSYNMAVNLVRNYDRAEAHRLLDSSFAQFLADRSVVSQARTLEHNHAQAAESLAAAACELGDFTEYWLLKERASTIRSQAREATAHVRTDTMKQALSALKPGDVLKVPGGRRRGVVVVVGMREGKPTALSSDRKERPFRLLPGDFKHPPSAIAHVTLPRVGRAHSPKYRREIAESLSALDLPAGVSKPNSDPSAAAIHEADVEASGFDKRASEHPCATCPDRAAHERHARHWSQIQERIARAERQMQSRTDTLGRRFDRVLAVLEELGYVSGFSCTPKGERLARIYGEGDLLVAEALAEGLFDDLDAPSTAALASTMVYETRERFPRPARMPTAPTADAGKRLARAWSRIHRAEQSQQVDLCRELDIGFAEIIYAWAAGDPLEKVLDEAAMTPGDFVRNCKQSLDLLRQIHEVAPEASKARAARDAINRGVVAYTGV